RRRPDHARSDVRTPSRTSEDIFTGPRGRMIQRALSGFDPEHPQILHISGCKRAFAVGPTIQRRSLLSAGRHVQKACPWSERANTRAHEATDSIFVAPHAPTGALAAGT